MKKIVTLLCTSLIVLLMFASPGNTGMASGNVVYFPEPPVLDHDPNCGCEDLVPLSGSERNKIVSNLLKNDVFKNQKISLEQEGYTWMGAGLIEVIHPEPEMPVYLLGVPFNAPDGGIEMKVFALFK